MRDADWRYHVEYRSAPLCQKYEDRNHDHGKTEKLDTDRLFPTNAP
jgi:hypothetical protein